MRVALDGTPLSVSTGGIARYTFELSVALAEQFPDDEYWLVSDQPFQCPGPSPANLRQMPAGGGFLQRWWWSCGLARELNGLGADVFHGTDFAVPYLPARPAVLTLHDLSPWKDPEWHSGADRVRRRTPWLIHLGLAGMIVTPTESVRREAIEEFRVHPSRVVATPLAASRRFQPSERRVPQKPYFLYVGVIEPRKNIPMLIEAWRESRKQCDADLILAGRRREDFPLPEAEEGVRFLGEVAEDDLPALYSNAVAFLYPSLYEGFGLPVLEAMSCGTAAMVSTDPALTEVAGDAAVRLDARAPKEWAGAMTLALTRPEWVAELREKALRRAAEFSWAGTARRTREVYEEARRRFGS